MYKIRQVESAAQLKRAVAFANRQFGIDFMKLEPKLYGNFDWGKTYVAVTEEGETVGMCSTYELNFSGIRALSVGTVCADENHRGEGIMSGLFRYLEENVFGRYDAIVLSGKRSRYEHYGFAKVLENINYKFQTTQDCGSAQVAEATEAQSGELYSLYERFGTGAVRRADSIFLMLSANGRKVLTIFDSEKKSYAVYDEEKKLVLEQCGELPVFKVLSAIARHFDVSEIEYRAPKNAHDRALSERAQSYSLFLRGNVLIKNVENFIVSTCEARRDNVSEIEFSVDGKCYALSVSSGKIHIGQIPRTNCEKNYTAAEFAYALFDFCGKGEPIGLAVKPIIPSSIIAFEGI